MSTFAEMAEAIDATRALLDELELRGNLLELAQNENSRLATLLLAKEAKIRALQAKLKLAGVATEADL